MEARGQFPSNSPWNIIELLNYSHVCTLGKISKLYGNYAIFEGKGSWNLWGNLFLIWRICKRKFWKGFRIYSDFCVNPKIVSRTDFFFLVTLIAFDYKACSQGYFCAWKEWLDILNILNIKDKNSKRQTHLLLYGGNMFRSFIGSSSDLLWNQVSECCVRVGIPIMLTNSRNITYLTIEMRKTDVMS